MSTAADRARAERADQGLGPTVTDPTALDRVATLINASASASAASTSSPGHPANGAVGAVNGATGESSATGADSPGGPKRPAATPRPVRSKKNAGAAHPGVPTTRGRRTAAGEV